ncbi:MAG: hypothetical protein DIU70_009570 [Bacillota bacterium]
MTLFLWFALVSALVGYVAASPMADPATGAGREADPAVGGRADAQAGVAGAPRISPGRGAWLGFLAGLAGDLLWALLMAGWTVASGQGPRGTGGLLTAGAAGLVAFAAVWWVMLRRVFRVEGPQLRRLAAILLLSYPVVLGLGIFLSR